MQIFIPPGYVNCIGLFTIGAAGSFVPCLAACSPSVRHILLYNRGIIVIASTGQYYESG